MTTQTDKLEIMNCCKVLTVENANASGSTFTNVKLTDLQITNANLTGCRIEDANLSRLEIVDAQIGGAYIHGIGLPPEDHPGHNPAQTRQDPVRFEDCDLNRSTFLRCDLTGVELTDCRTEGMRINGIPVEELLRAYEAAERD